MKTVSPAAKYRPLLLATLAVIALPFALQLLGLSLTTGTLVVALAIAAMGLNLCIGYTGLVSFGHGTWFGIGAYAAGLIQLHWFRGEIWLPLLLSMVVVAIASTLVGIVILRRFYTADPILSLLVTFGLALVAEQAIRILWGAAPLSASIPPVFRGSVFVGDFLFSRYRLLILAVEIGRAHV